jgi:hypothetical protein
VPPGFEGVTPGKTSAEEAMKIWDSNPAMVVLRQGIDDTFPERKYGFISWEWAVSELDEGYARYSLTEGHLITSIGPGFYDQGQVSLADAIERFGEPSHVFAQPEYDGGGPYFPLDVVFLDYGFMLSTSSARTPPSITQEMFFENVTFFAPTQVGLDLVMLPEWFQNAQVEWQGFQSYGFYCRDTEGESLC